MIDWPPSVSQEPRPKYTRTVGRWNKPQDDSIRRSDMPLDTIL